MDSLQFFVQQIYNFFNSTGFHSLVFLIASINHWLPFSDYFRTLSSTMTDLSFQEHLLNTFGMLPTKEQRLLFEALEGFMRQREGKHVFILKGYAGTGKTSVLGSFVQVLRSYKVNTILLAPTGRAAKVLSHKSGGDAFTIHKQIYRRKSKVDPYAGMGLQPNLHRNTVFVVDEASMIGDSSFLESQAFGSRSLLEDLMEYVFSADGCKLILLGDEGQLPPVGSDYSPALNRDYLEAHFPMIHFHSHVLSEVVRQEHDSSVLHNATLLRSTVWEDYPKFELTKNGDLQRLNGLDLQEALESSYSKVGEGETIIITRSNKQANLYNQQVRGRILWYEEQLCSGDCLMVVKNNYFWLGEDTRIGFVANGELIRVVRVVKTTEMYGFQFAVLLVRFVDYPELGEVELIAHTETLTVESPALSRDRLKELFYAVEIDYAHIREKKKRYEAILSDPYFNALQIKYAYAVTCHKSQGGQWAHVYIDQGYIPEDQMSSDYYRWLYTALTRATEKVYLVNFADDFFTDPST